MSNSEMENKDENTFHCKKETIELTKPTNNENEQIKESTNDINSNKSDEYSSMTYLFSFMLFITTSAAIILVYILDSSMADWKLLRPDYDFPSIFDFKICFLFAPILIVNILSVFLRKN